MLAHVSTNHLPNVCIVYRTHTSQLAKLPKLPYAWRIAGSGALHALEKLLMLVWANRQGPITKSLSLANLELVCIRYHLSAPAVNVAPRAQCGTSKKRPEPAP